MENTVKFRRSAENKGYTPEMTNHYEDICHILEIDPLKAIEHWNMGTIEMVQEMQWERFEGVDDITSMLKEEAIQTIEEMLEDWHVKNS